ncbi:uncharacterized protein LOC143052104 [Mytilus galloprovincialis]|uniref:uncharacterized protein LOC143052104 n=1 Tax=Mytilus galloprovincialis TaxID=29158 RepID=UPI003F7CC38F
MRISTCTFQFLYKHFVYFFQIIPVKHSDDKEESWMRNLYDVVEEISIPEKIATLERCDEIATTERYHEETLENDDVIEEIYVCEEIATTERCNNETVENDEEDKAASDSTTFYDIAEIGITTSRGKNSDDLKADHHDAEKGKLDDDDKAASESKTSYSINDILAAHQQTEKQGLALQKTKEDENKKVRYMYNSYIKDKKIDDATSTTTARKKAIKRKLFDEDKGEQDFINLKKLPKTDKMKMVKNFIVNSNKAVADVPKHRSEVDVCMELLGETDDTRNVIKFQMSLEKHPGNKSFATSLDIHMAKLQTSMLSSSQDSSSIVLTDTFYSMATRTSTSMDTSALVTSPLYTTPMITSALVTSSSFTFTSISTCAPSHIVDRQVSTS